MEQTWNLAMKVLCMQWTVTRKLHIL